MLAWAICLPAAFAQGYRFAPDPPGVVSAFQVESDQPATASDGIKYLVAADQVLLTGARPLWHRTTSYRVVDERGLEEGGQFSLTYQPTYQQVEIHAIDVVRDGQRLDRRQASRIDELRRESGLESRLLDGRLTVTVTVPDLRVGDTVTYRYSVIGDNPVFKGGYHDSYSARFGVPLGLRLVSFRYPQALSLQSQVADGFETTQRDEGNTRTLEASMRNLAAVSEEENTPSSYNPYGRIEVSTAADWRDVVGWALPLYPRTFVDRSELMAVSSRLRLDRADPMGSALRAVAFVQGEVRYTGLDMGTNSHAPNRPELVLARRFGDCKDKATLLIALLSEVGIPADPVLVNTEQKAAVAGRLPSPLAFNHVIVRARLQGRDIWIDPTLERERGDFQSRRSLPFGYGLPIQTGANALVRIPDLLPDAPQVDVRQSIKLGVNGEQLSADFAVATDYRQGFADDVRKAFSMDGPEKVGKSYLNYMQGYYEGLRAQAMPNAGERDASFNVQEQYRLDWKKSEATIFGIVFFQILDWLPKIADQERHSPLALGGPRYGRQTIRTTLADGWSIDPQRDRIATAFFRFERSVSVDGSELVIVSTWQRYADEIPAAEVAKIRPELARIRELLQYDVDLEPESPWLSSKPRDWLWPLAVLPLTILLLGVAWLLRRRFALAGMLYRPRVTVQGFMARGGIGALGAILVWCAIAMDASFELGSRATNEGRPGFLAGMALALLVGLGVRWFIWVGATQLAFRLLGQRLAFGSLWRVSGWASVPMIALSLAAAAALKFDFSSLADKGVPTPAQLPGLIIAVALMVAGVAWTLVAMINGYAALAGIRRRRALAAWAIAGAFLLPFAILFFVLKA